METSEHIRTVYVGGKAISWHAGSEPWAYDSVIPLTKTNGIQAYWRFSDDYSRQAYMSASAQEKAQVKESVTRDFESLVAATEFDRNNGYGWGSGGY